MSPHRAKPGWVLNMQINAATAKMKSAFDMSCFADRMLCMKKSNPRTGINLTRRAWTENVSL
jgi:hypothetical protein